MTEENISLEEVVITNVSDKTFNSVRKGASINITSETVDVIPGISRSINDLTKLIPQSNRILILKNTLVT